MQELPMADEKRSNTVSRAEFYSTVALVLLFPAILFLGSGGFPETLPRQLVTGLVFITMIGMSIAYSILSIQERGRQARENHPQGPPR
jgi:hypothetical protein